MCAVTADKTPRMGRQMSVVRRMEQYVEEVIRKEVVNKRPVSGIETEKPKPIVLSEIEADDEPRIDLHDEELTGYWEVDWFRAPWY